MICDMIAAFFFRDRLMPMALVHPQINPNIFEIGPIHATWYGLMYVIGFMLGYWLGKRRSQKMPNWNAAMLDDLLTYLMIAVILGGRVGYVLFYGMSYWAQDWLYPLKIYQGGMSFHGGLLGVVFACFLFARKYRMKTLTVGDFVAPLFPLGLFFGRLGNFINGELWGRVTDVPWAMIFPHAPDYLPRHPTQLYEAALEGLVLFIVLYCYARKPRPRGRVVGVFLLGYGIARFIVEFWRQPDAHLGFIGFHWLTMGQALCIPMIVIGIGLCLRPVKAQ